VLPKRGAWSWPRVGPGIYIDPAFPKFVLQHGFDDSGRQFGIKMYTDTCIYIDVPIHRRFIYKGGTSTRAQGTDPSVAL